MLHGSGDSARPITAKVIYFDFECGFDSRQFSLGIQVTIFAVHPLSGKPTCSWYNDSSGPVFWAVCVKVSSVTCCGLVVSSEYSGFLH